MTPLRWAGTMGGMVLGYMAAGPMGGFAGLILGWWLARPRQRKVRRDGGHDRSRSKYSAGGDAGLGQAYSTLGLRPGASDQAVRDAYRRLRSVRHPDKLAASGASDAELRAAQQSAAETRKAYDTIRARSKAGVDDD